MADVARPLARRVEHPAAEAQHLLGPLRSRVGEERGDVDLRVPEVVALVAMPGQPLGRHAEAFAARGRLHELEEVEAHGLLEVGRAVELDVAARPELLDAAAVVELDHVVAVARRTVERAIDARDEVPGGSLRDPVVGDVPRQPQRHARLELGLDDELGAVALGAGLHRHGRGGLDRVLHPARELQPAGARHQRQHRAVVVRTRRDRHEHLLGEALATAWVVRGLPGPVGDQLG